LPALRIPENDRVGLALLRDMPSESFAAFLAALERSPEAIADIPGVSPDDARLAIDALKSMYQARTYNDVPIDEFISDVCESLTESKVLESGDEPLLRERLARLLDIESLSISAKALVLRTDYPYIYCAARIFTDIRPVFGEDASETPPAMVLAHTLKLEYHGALGHLHELYVALRADDIAELREILKRADTKAKTLESMLKPLETKLIDPLAD
jgi:hypothetical protein